MKQFSKWSTIKQKIEFKNKVFFKQREMFYAHLGENIGFEQCGKGENFVRPVLVYKKFNNSVFLGIPLSTTLNRGQYYFEFNFKQDKRSIAVLSQIKLIDAKRLDRKIGKINQDDFKNLQKQLLEILE